MSTPGSNCAPAAWRWHKAAMSKASLAGLWAVKRHSGEHGAAEGVFGLLAGKEPCYNGRGIEGVYSFTSVGNRDSTESLFQERDRKKKR